MTRHAAFFRNGGNRDSRNSQYFLMYDENSYIFVSVENCICRLSNLVWAICLQSIPDCMRANATWVSHLPCFNLCNPFLVLISLATGYTVHSVPLNFNPVRSGIWVGFSIFLIPLSTTSETEVRDPQLADLLVGKFPGFSVWTLRGFSTRFLRRFFRLTI